ncbi:uncharacterized protein LOC110031832 [Phalaenopsis equestris]|uniref:uncharacterized protein LOC110031832 n=1 Tax=Phalaenopsis equestris TaxID=78828 RepID=UPI0009E3F26E|nr:uncharacterized protein LOC110031832 [Phalaenopsis equestris]
MSYVFIAPGLFALCVAERLSFIFGGTCFASKDRMSLKEKFSERWKPFERSLQFWVQAADIYAGYKVCQLRTRLVKDAGEQEAMWERQHEIAAEKMYFLCSDLGGLFLKAAQIFGKPDLAPAAWVRRLVTLYDRAPETPVKVVQQMVEEELGKNFHEVFERFDIQPVGSASIAQVHRARLRHAKTDVAVKVQHPGVENLMMVDIHNLQALAKFLQREIKFDLFSLTKEVEKQIQYEFDFRREAEAMERIRNFFGTNNRKTPVLVPRVINGMVTRKVLVMEFIHGIPIMNLGHVIAQRGIDPGGKLATAAKRKILENLTLAYGQMILKSGFFHADPHPGNILICKDSKVALLDYGQVKNLPDNLRLGFANLVIAIADKNPTKAAQSYRELGIETLNSDDVEELFQLAIKMFDTKLPRGMTVLSPFSEDSSLKKISVQSFPEELFSVLRTMQLLRGLSVGMGISYSCAEQWRPLAEEALYRAGRLNDNSFKAKRSGILQTLFRRGR